MIAFLLFLLSCMWIIFVECILTPVLVLCVCGVCALGYIYLGWGALADGCWKVALGVTFQSLYMMSQ